MLGTHTARPIANDAAAVGIRREKKPLRGESANPGQLAGLWAAVHPHATRNRLSVAKTEARVRRRWAGSPGRYWQERGAGDSINRSRVLGSTRSTHAPARDTCRTATRGVLCGSCRCTRRDRRIRRSRRVSSAADATGRSPVLGERCSAITGVSAVPGIQSQCISNGFRQRWVSRARSIPQAYDQVSQKVALPDGIEVSRVKVSPRAGATFDPC